MRIVRVVGVALLVVVLLGLPGTSQAACPDNAISFAFTDPVTGHAIEMRHTVTGDSLFFRTRQTAKDPGLTLGGSGARVRLDGDRISGSLRTRDVTILVHGSLQRGQVIGAAVRRVSTAPVLVGDMGQRSVRRPLTRTVRTSYVVTVGAGRKLEVSCGG